MFMTLNRRYEISIPSGAIKSLNDTTAPDRYIKFQFLLVRLREFPLAYIITSALKFQFLLVRLRADIGAGTIYGFS